MMLGVMLFFDGALLALGNVRSSFHHSSPAPNVYSRPSPPAQRMQILFLGGLFLIIGPQKTFYFFARRNKLRGTACFLGGILLVFFKWPTIGVLVEMFGFLNLFGCVDCNIHARVTALTQLKTVTLLCLCLFSDFFPVIITFLRQLPFIGQFLNLPYVRPVR